MAGLLRRLTSGGVALYLMHGNRDFLLAERFCEATGARLLADPTVHEIQGVRTLLVHGDTLCTDDVDYQNWRRIARSEAWQRGFLAKPLAERRRDIRACARKARKSSRRSRRDHGRQRSRGGAGDGERRRHPHGPRPSHRPQASCANRRGRPAERWVLPDWYERGGYLEIGRGAPSSSSSNSYPGR